MRDIPVHFMQAQGDLEIAGGGSNMKLHEFNPADRVYVHCDPGANVAKITASAKLRRKGETTLIEAEKHDLQHGGEAVFVLEGLPGQKFFLWVQLTRQQGAASTFEVEVYAGQESGQREGAQKLTARFEASTHNRRPRFELWLV